MDVAASLHDSLVRFPMQNDCKMDEFCHFFQDSRKGLSKMKRIIKFVVLKLKLLSVLSCSKKVSKPKWVRIQIPLASHQNSWMIQEILLNVDPADANPWVQWNVSTRHQTTIASVTNHEICATVPAAAATTSRRSLPWNRGHQAPKSLHAATPGGCGYGIAQVVRYLNMDGKQFKHCNKLPQSASVGPRCA